MSVPPPRDRIKRFENIACEFKVDRNIPILRYFRSGVEMLRMADTYYNEDNHEKAYILYLKYVTLFIEKLKLHPEYKTVAKSEMPNVVKNVRVAMTRLEEMKKILTERFEREFEEFSAILEMKRAEMSRLETEMKKKKLEEEGKRLREELNKYHDEKERALAIQRDREIAIWHQLQIDQELADEENAQRMTQLSLDDDDPSQPCATDQKPQFDRGLKPKTPSHAPSAPPIPSRSLKPSSSLYSSTGLRTVRIPSILMAKFLSLADPNTSANIETCGILAGKLQNNAFRITHLLIPKQKGTSDSCDTCGEEAIFEYQDSHDLITLGWIHTHPSQTAFLSSVDLHTQLSYQLMLPEAIAIVMAPKFNQTGFFVLTQNYGLDYIGNCRESGFHPHPNEPPLFEEGSHFELDESADVILADLR